VANVSGDAWGGDIGLVTPMKLRVWYTEDRIFDVTNSEEVIAPWTISGGGGTTYIQGELINGGLTNTSLINDSLMRV
jgi:hypothetical protein